MSIATSLLEALSELPDPRLERGKEHRWSELLFIAVCTLLTGGESFYDMEDFASMREEWLRTLLVLPGGPPSQDTFNRLFQMLDPAAFAETFARWTESLRGVLPADGGHRNAPLLAKRGRQSAKTLMRQPCLILHNPLDGQEPKR